MVAKENVSAGTVGEKAFGLSCIPEPWRTEFFVVDLTNGSLPADEVLAQALASLGPDAERLIVRSNEASESMLWRGRHESLVSGITELNECFLRASESAAVTMFVVQAYIKTRSKGHLSNERRVKEEPRDWVWEVEAGEHAGATKSIAIRQWRKSAVKEHCPMVARTALHIHSAIKEVAQWGTQFLDRLHFEWVWNGDRVFLVQLDTEVNVKGYDPRESIRVPFEGSEPLGLQCFVASDCCDLPSIRKLENARLYTRLGYQMPRFYILNNIGDYFDHETGILSDELLDDLQELTKSPLIIRTDGTSIPEKKREMLPRTDELRTLDGAVTWFKEKVMPLMCDNDNESWGLVLIAHHFIPSVSSAWARADPLDNYVQIEALWGIPEGLYWFAHDTMIVRIRKRASSIDSEKISIESISRRTRYKGNFVSPNSEGCWVVKEVLAPLDWRPVIPNQSWVEEIARTTFSISESAAGPVSVMWFVQNHPKSTKHSVLPWFHSETVDLGSVRAAPIKKYSASHLFSISTLSDWEEFRRRLNNGEMVERCNVSPTDPELIRNNEFVTELGNLAVSFNVTIVLQGGLLSHVYYILKREGARIECVDLWGAESHVVEYFKLVRDKIPGRITDNGERFQKVELRGEAKLRSLREKLLEEAIEALDAPTLDQLVEELADILEICQSLCKEANIPFSQVVVESDRKREERGGFENGIMLTQTITPPPIHRDEEALVVDSVTLNESWISSIDAIPRRSVYRSSDHRHLQNGRIEKLLVCEFELGQIGAGVSVQAILEALQGEGTLKKQVLSVKCLRKGSTIRIETKVAMGPSMDAIQDGQLSLPF